MIVRESFSKRLEELMEHFSLHSFGWETVAIQLMNDFPRWKPDELRLVARRTDIAPNKLESLYLKSWRKIREPRLEEQKHHNVRRMNHESGFIQEIEGQAWEYGKNANPFSGAKPPPFRYEVPPRHNYDFQGKSMEDIYSQMFGGDVERQKAFEDMLREDMNAWSGTKTDKRTEQRTEPRQEPPKQSGASQMEDMMRRAAGQHARTGFDTKKPWQAAPAYLHMHFEILTMSYPITMDDAKKQFRKRAMETHPDRNPGKEEEFKKVATAWERIEEFLKRS